MAVAGDAIACGGSTRWDEPDSMEGIPIERAPLDAQRAAREPKQSRAQRGGGRILSWSRPESPPAGLATARIAPCRPAVGRFRPNAVQSALPDDGRFRKAPSRVFRRRSSTGGHRLGISHSPPTRRRSGPPPRDRRVSPSAPDGHLRVRLAGQQRIPGHAPLRVELARRRAPRRVALSDTARGAAAPPRRQPPRSAASAGSFGTGARSIPRAGRLSAAPTRARAHHRTGAIS